MSETYDILKKLLSCLLMILIRLWCNINKLDTNDKLLG